MAEKLNFYRYLSHFRAVHRGAFFTEMRTTSVRKLLPEAWGMTHTRNCAISYRVVFLQVFFVQSTLLMAHHVAFSTIWLLPAKLVYPIPSILPAFPNFHNSTPSHLKICSI